MRGMSDPITIFVPAAPHRPPMTLTAPAVDELPAAGRVGDLLTYKDQLWFWTGQKWGPSSSITAAVLRAEAAGRPAADMPIHTTAATPR
jgi:hypothetical protein